MNLDDFSTVVDDRRYINPQVALDESNAFIQKLRDTQSSRNEQIQRDTYNLGTAVPSNLGGLGGSQSYFNARYQTPQTNSLVADLKATAQAQALSDIMSNEVAKAKQRYSNAYKAYAKRSGNNPGTTGGDDVNPNFNNNDGTPPTDPGNPSASDYISGGYKFGELGNFMGQDRKYPKWVDGPTTSTSYQEYTYDIKDPLAKSQAWVNYLNSIGYGG